MACISNNDKIHLNKNTVKKERTKIMANTIRKNDIVTSIVETTSMTKTEANRAFDIIFETISNALAKGDSVQISGFGTFEVRERAARTGRNQSVIFCGQFNTCPSVPLPTPAFALV